jgi:uncharacterized protein (TIGR03435 family)
LTAYPDLSPWQFVDIPNWAIRNFYDIAGKGDPRLPAPTAAQRASMMQALLADRFAFRAHFESRRQPIFELLTDERNPQRSSQLRPVADDCERVRGALEHEARKQGLMSPSVPQAGAIPPCLYRMTQSSIEGVAKIAELVAFLRHVARRHVVDRTGLLGYYRLSFSADSQNIRDVVAETLGLRLRAAEGNVPVLAIDRLNGPSTN